MDISSDMIRHSGSASHSQVSSMGPSHPKAKKVTSKTTGSSNKITRDMLLTSLRLLGDEAKKCLRFNIIFEDGILDPDIAKEATWKAVTDAVKKSPESQKKALQRGLDQVLMDEDEKTKLLTYVRLDSNQWFSLRYFIGGLCQGLSFQLDCWKGKDKGGWTLWSHRLE